MRARCARKSTVRKLDEPAPTSRKSEKAEREGLPPGYRMRADAHYVENLTSRRGARGVARARVRSSRTRSDRLLDQLAEDLGTIESAAQALAADGARMARRVNTDLIKSQVWRAGWALRAHALLGGRHRAKLRPRPLGFLLGQIRSGWAAECRLASVNFEVAASDWNAVVSVDEHSFIAGVSGAVIATLGLIGETDDASLTLQAVTSSAGQLRCDRPHTSRRPRHPERRRPILRRVLGRRPGGWLAGLGAAVAKAAAQQHGGDAVFLTDEEIGSTVGCSFRSKV